MAIMPQSITTAECKNKINKLLFGDALIAICMANSADPDQTVPKEQSDQGIHYFFGYFCLSFKAFLMYRLVNINHKILKETNELYHKLKRKFFENQ